MRPEDWSCEITTSVLQPVKTLKPLVPDFILLKNFQKSVEVSAIAVPCGNVTNSLEETIDGVLCNSFPEDCESNDKDCHKQIRHESLINSTTSNDPLFTLHEIDAVVCKLKPEKATGPDSIPNEVIKKLHKMYPHLPLKDLSRAFVSRPFLTVGKKLELS
ncbi:hypothetical protein AVEN_91776-1 [Araneus ventricosus]|uniref:Uncharacterized protein n=1 Tax=Araneus ventricosus TaxID=182803 RepID=A0A4Y2IS39_ARAVE|nr:hypothetical protein AVEN_91776-1 [Araneus ventricosus]